MPDETKKPMRLLVVDDDVLLRRSLALQLTRAGYQVVEAEDGQQAWEMLQAEAFRFIITDWSMPVMDGLELVRKVRAAGLPGYTYIMLLTANTRKADVVTGLEAGADDYLTKPFDLHELRARVAIGVRILDLEARLLQSLAQVQELAVRDGLTGLYNRRAFDQRLADEVQRAARYWRPLSLMILDIDHFKQVNDSYGHPHGDQVLRDLAGLLRGCVRSTDFVARYGGEEFAIILPETSLQNAVAVAQLIQARVAGYSFAPPQAGEACREFLTLSVGLAEHSSANPAPEALLEAADRALYQAKQGGRNRVAVID
jgi:two-component system, cell cycle response regulator